MAKRENVKIAVIGAGIAGLAAAHELTKTGLNVTVFEASATPGGRMESIKKDGWTFDPGADFLADNYKTTKSLAKEMDIQWVPTLPNALHRIIRDGRAHLLELDKPTDVFKLKFLSLKDRVAFAWWCLRLRFGKQLPSFFELTKIKTRNYVEENAFDYLAENISREVAVYIADAFTSIMQFHRAREIDVDTLRALMQIFVRPYDRFSIRYTPEGMSAICIKLAENLNIKLSTPVNSITLSGKKIAITTNSGSEQFDYCVLATTANAAARIAPSFETLKNILASVEYASTITLSFQMPANIFPERVHISYVAFEENQVIAGYTNEGRKPGIVPNGSGETLINIYLHEEAAKKFADLSDEEVTRSVLAELPKVLPEIRGKENLLSFHMLKRIPFAVPKFSPSHVRNVRAFEIKHQGENNIFLAGDYFNSPWVEGAARSGVRAAEAIIERLSL